MEERPRIYSIVITNLASEKEMLEEELERLANSNINVEEKVNSIKETLHRIVEVEMMVSKWQSYFETDNNER